MVAIIFDYWRVPYHFDTAQNPEFRPRPSLLDSTRNKLLREMQHPVGNQAELLDDTKIYDSDKDVHGNVNDGIAEFR